MSSFPPPPRGEYSRASDKTHYIEENPKPIKLAAVAHATVFPHGNILGISENTELCAVAQNLMGAAGMDFAAAVRMGHGAPARRWGTRATRRIICQGLGLPLCGGS